MFLIIDLLPVVNDDNDCYVKYFGASLFMSSLCLSRVNFGPKPGSNGGIYEKVQRMWGRKGVKQRGVWVKQDMATVNEVRWRGMGKRKNKAVNKVGQTEVNWV